MLSSTVQFSAGLIIRFSTLQYFSQGNNQNNHKLEQMSLTKIIHSQKLEDSN